MNPNTHERGLRNDPNQPALAPTARRAQVGEQTYGRSPASGPAPTTAGHHSHDILNKLDPRVDSTHDSKGMPQQQQKSSNVPEGTYGPHRSRLANALDPRVDSDLDSKRTGAGMGAGGGLGGGEVPAGAGAGAARGTGIGTGTVTGMGMHSAPGHGHGHGYEHGTATAAGGGQRTGLQPAVGGATGAYDQPQPQRQHHGVIGEGIGGGAHHQTAGIGGTGGTTAGARGVGGGGAPAGPHKSSLMNKLDPRVDSKTGMTKDSSGGSGWVKY